MLNLLTLLTKGAKPAVRVVHLNRLYTLRFVGTT